MHNGNIQLKTIGNRRFLWKFFDPKVYKPPIIYKKYPRIQFYQFPKRLIFPEQFQTVSDLPDDITHLSIATSVRNFPNLFSKDPQGCQAFLKKQTILEMIALILHCISKNTPRFCAKQNQKLPSFFFVFPSAKKPKWCLYGTNCF